MTTRISLQTLASTASIGALAVSASLPTAASAQSVMGQGAASGYKVSAEGGLAVSDFSNQTFADKGGVYEKDEGFYGAVSVSKAISDTWDWRVSASAMSFGDNTALIFDGPDPLFSTQTFSAGTVDLDIGRVESAGSTNVRLGFGVIAANIKQSFTNTLPSFGFDGGVDTSFKGFGLKLSADVSHPLSRGSALRLIGGASIAPMSGTFKTTPTGDKLGSGVGDSTNGNLVLTSAYLGLGYDFSDKAGMRFGVRSDHFEGNTGFSGTSGTIDDGSVSTTAAFVGVDIQF